MLIRPSMVNRHRVVAENENSVSRVPMIRKEISSTAFETLRPNIAKTGLWRDGWSAKRGPISHYD